MRENVPPTTLAKVSTARVLATPGTPSSSTCPLGEQTHQDALEELVLADDDPLDLEERPFRVCTSAARPLPPDGVTTALAALYPPGDVIHLHSLLTRRVSDEGGTAYLLGSGGSAPADNYSRRYRIRRRGSVRWRVGVPDPAPGQVSMIRVRYGVIPAVRTD